MNDILAAAPIVLTPVIAFNIFITLALLRRVRQLAEAELKGEQISKPLPEFAATAESGQAITESDLLQDDAIIGFFSPTCEPCKTQFPRFVDLAARLGQGKSFAVITGDRQLAQPLIEAANAHATVLHETGYDGPIISSFDVTGFPTYVKVERGRIVYSGYAVDKFSAQVALV